MPLSSLKVFNCYYQSLLHTVLVPFTLFLFLLVILRFYNGIILHTLYLLCMLDRNRKERVSGLLDCMREFTRLWWVVQGLFIAILASVLIIHCGENNVFDYNHAAHKSSYDIKPFAQLDLHLIFKLDQYKIPVPRYKLYQHIVQL